jgi:hypothetical protein
LQNPRLHPSRGLLSATLPANRLAAPQRPGAKIRWAAADGAARHSGSPRHSGYSAAAGRACFTRSEQASVSLVEERPEGLEAGLYGILVDDSARLDVTLSRFARVFRIRSLRFFVAQKHNASLSKPLAVSQGGWSAPHPVLLIGDIPGLTATPREQNFHNPGRVAKVGLALLVGTVFDEDEPGEDDLAAYASSSSDGLASWRSGVSNPSLNHW